METSRNGRGSAVLIAGPTASGKSALALRRAAAAGGVVINADAMQVYDVLRVVTARPAPEDMGNVPHRLYGSVPPSRRFSTGDWLRAVKALLDDPEVVGRELIFVGGTGLYFEALVNGFADVPDVPPEALAAAEAELVGLDREQRGKLIAARDPLIAARLKAPDPQRVARALAVLNATGRSLARFQDDVQAGLLGGFEIERIVLNPDREVLRERIARRFGGMMESGAVAEVEALRALKLDPALPAMKAIGVPEISDWLDGRIDRATAIERATIATRQYAKRQRTWFRARMADWRWVDPLTGRREGETTLPCD
ncbi:tRNA (adenosine(37)-N6)-dimethylallyltransferase MiaA [Devosia sp.]|jgi:tRNA dimethylallyltransferase|uniref:tRNA (adenosine(37)-N6)-dimethylallyltransferase MiaA n=1 Tax=Devosia sp. TaxID=1871048 RepID=UPI0037C09C9A